MSDMTREERVMYNNALYWARVRVERERAFQQEAYRQALAEHGLMPPASIPSPRPRPAWVSDTVWWLVVCTWAIILASFASSFLL